MDRAPCSSALVRIGRYILRLLPALRLLPSLALAFGSLACTNEDTSTRGPAERYATDVTALVADGAPPTLAAPKRLEGGIRPTERPCWTASGLLLRQFPPELALSRVEKPGMPVFDPSSDAWYASANGMLVRIEPDALPVVTGGIQGVDVDVRAQAGLAVSREPNDTIVLHRFAKGASEREVLMAGPGYFQPRFSPSAHAIVVTESRAGGGRIWVAELGERGEPTVTRELAQGTSPSWHPDGRHLIFARVQHDGSTLKSSTLWMLDVANGEERSVGKLSVPGVHPVVSPGGEWIAMVDGGTGEVLVARFDNPFAGEEGGR